MKTLFFIGLLLASGMVYGQKNPKAKPIVLSANSFYLLCRGTQQKVGLIAHKFNLNDQFSTHVGIGFMEKGALIVYNVNNDTADKTALIREKLNAFIGVKDLSYWSIWECRSSAKEILKLKKLLQSYRTKKIVFDMDFEPNNSKFYCSEFCAEILKALNPQNLSFPLTKKPLDLLFRGALNRDVLNYYPVDFFQSDAHFKKIYEVHQQPIP